MKVKEIGNLTVDPNYGVKNDLRYCNFRIAINDPNNTDRTQYVQVSSFDDLADECRDRLQKGSQIGVEGTVSARAYLDKDKQPRASLQINAKEITFLNRTKQIETGNRHAEIDNALAKSGQNPSPPAQPLQKAQAR